VTWQEAQRQGGAYTLCQTNKKAAAINGGPVASRRNSAQYKSPGHTAEGHQRKPESGPWRLQLQSLGLHDHLSAFEFIDLIQGHIKRQRKPVAR